MSQVWMERRLNMSEVLQRIRQNPLIDVLHFLTMPTGRHEFRDLSDPIWVCTKRLDIDASNARLRHCAPDALGRFFCPVMACKKNYKYHGRLVIHLSKHNEITRLEAELRDHVMNDLIFTLPSDSGLRSTVLSPEVYASFLASVAPLPAAVT